MKKTSKSLYTIAALAFVLVGFYTVDFNSDQASIVTLPDFDTEVQSAQDTPINNLKDLNDAVVNVAEKTNPTVVTIVTEQTIQRPDNPLFRFFGDPRDEGGRQAQGLGSGVIVSQDGYILTNHHVVDAADEISVETYEGNVLEAEVIGSDPMTDIAVLKINAENLPAIGMGNSDQLRVGEFVMAIGSPFGQNFAHSVSFGIVSGKGRVTQMAERTGSYQSFIQTDAAINPGNSGGALINLDGQLVGINSMIASRSGGNQGVGFAIPVNMARNIMNQLIETGEVQRGYLGITGGPVDRTMAQALGLDKPKGVIVGGVQDDGPAMEAGLREGDVITTVNGKTVEGWYSFRTEIASHQPGDEVELGVIRDGSQQTITVTLSEQPESMQFASNQQEGRSNQNLEQSLGFNVQNLTPDIARQLELDTDQEGVVVTGISRTSSAYRQGLREGDVITSVAREPVTNVDEFSSAISQFVEQEGEQAVLLRVIRGGNGIFVAFEL